jgi:hypothetical protein
VKKPSKKKKKEKDSDNEEENLEGDGIEKDDADRTEDGR